jgi:CheY-like chemotaxis protein
MKKLVILLVEDNSQDAFLVTEALEEQEFIAKIHHVEDGAKAILFLKKLPPYENEEQPNLILMDINMPIMNGHEALKKIKSIPEIKHIPVLMLTTSSRNEDILKAYREQTSSYIVKPDDIYALDNLAATMKNYWTSTVRLPEE